MKILLLGKNGQVGWALQQSLAHIGQLVACDKRQMDVTRFGALRALIHEVKPDFVVNAAAYTAVDAAQTDPDLAYRVNAEAVQCMAEAVRAVGACLVHYSTDYVFDGRKTEPYTEHDEPAPLNVYGTSKRAGELAIRTVQCRHVILRTSWVFGRKGNHFIRKILKKAQEEETLEVVADQVGAPTSAELIAEITALIVHQMKLHPEFAEEATGLYHLAPKGYVSFHGYAQFLLSLAALKGIPLRTSVEKIIPVSTRERPQAAKRPANSRLSSELIESIFGLELPPWQWGVRRYMEEWRDTLRAGMA